MVNSCAVFGCTNRSTRDRKSYYVLPSVITNQGDQTKELSEKRRRQWIANLRRTSFTPSRHTRICSDHFISGKPAPLYDTTNPDWAPTLRMGDASLEPHKDKKNLEAAETLLNLGLLFQGNGINNVNTETRESAELNCEKSTQTDPLEVQRTAEECVDLREKLLHQSNEIQRMKEEIQRLTAENLDLRAEREAGSDPSPDLIRGVREELQRLTTENMDLRQELEEMKLTSVVTMKPGDRFGYVGIF
ncbi:THAP domain-containing protein 1-like [Antennarius striatus]|uniref:THAP domain-containing protein 1-like n=1 Tax=Antennarius striatus TaxID=241820 RepID=UPI0035B4B36E